MNARVTRVVAVVLALALVTLGGWWGYTRLLRPERSAATSGSGSSDNGRHVVALGRLEPAGGLVSVGAIAGERLAGLTVGEGEHVEAGQSLGTLQSRTARKLEEQSLESQVEEAVARIEAEEKLADARIATAKIALEKAGAQQAPLAAQQKKIDVLKAQAAQGQKDLKRFANLSLELVSEQEREQQTLAIGRSEAELAAAEAELEQLSEGTRLQVAAAEADLAAAEAAKEQVRAAIPVESLRSRLELAKLQYGWTELAAPHSGTVLKIYQRPGELIGTSPVLVMADLSQMVCIAELYEVDRHRVAVGDTATLRSAALRGAAGIDAQASSEDAGALRGKVTRVGQLIATPQLKALDPFARSDRRVVEVRIELDEANSRRASELVNLEVEVTFGSAP